MTSASRWWAWARATSKSLLGVGHLVQGARDQLAVAGRAGGLERDREVGHGALHVATRVAVPAALEVQRGQALVAGGRAGDGGVVVDERLLARVDAGRRPRRAHVVLEAPPVVAGHGEVVGQRGGDVVERVGVQGLERLARAPVQPRAPGGRELAVDRLADQRVREAIPADRVGRLDQHALGQGVVHGLEQSLAVEAGDPLERVELELGPEHGRGGQRGPLELVQAPHPAQQEVLDALGHARLQLRLGPAHELLDEERVALGPVGHGPQGAGAERNPALAHELGHRVGRQPRERHLLEHAGAAQLGDGAGQRIVLAHLELAVGAEHEQGRVPQGARELAQQQQRGRVGPLQVVEHEDGGPSAGGLAQERGHGVEQRVAVAVAAGVGRLGLRGSARELGDEPGQDRPGPSRPAAPARRRARRRRSGAAPRRRAGTA